MYKRACTLLTFLLLTLVAAPLAAQEGDAGAKEGESVVILQFETFNTEQEVMDLFYSHLHEAIEQKKGMYVKPGGDATIGDLILTAGCESATPDCLKGLSDFIDGDKLVFGSVQYSDGVHLITVKMFDFAEGEFVREIADQTIEGEPSEIGDNLKAVIEGFIYGDVGQVAVDISGTDEAVVLFNGEKRGMAPTKLDGLPLGQHVVTVRVDSGQEKSKTVVLRQGRVSKLSFNFDPAAGGGTAGSGPVASGGSSAYEVPGWAAVGIGVGGLVVGILGTSQLNSAVNETDSIICGDPGRLCTGVAPSRAHDLQSEMDSGRTLQVVGFSMAAVGIGIGSYLLYQTYAGGSAETESASSDNNLRIGVAPSKRGVSMGLSVDF